MHLRVQRSTLEWTILLFLSFAILWKGGKALDATWGLALVACGVILADIFFVQRKERGSPSPLLWTAALLFLLWTLASFVSSSTANYGFDEVMQTASLFLLFSFALTIAETHRHQFQSRLARIIAVTTLVACIIGIAVYTLQPVNRFVGTFFDYRFQTDYWPNAWAEFLLLSWPMVVWSLFGRPQKKETSYWLQACILGIIFGCLLLSYSRGGLIAFFIQVLLLGAFVFWKWNRKLPVQKILTVAGSSVIAAVIIFLGINHLRSNFNTVESVIDKVTFSSSEGTSSVSERSQFWQQAMALTKEKPLLGWGPYSFRFVQPHIQGGVLATSDHPHNVFLKFALERGVVAALLFLLIVIVSLASGIKSSIRERDARVSFLIALFVISAIGVLLHNLIDFNLQFVAISLPLWLILGTFPVRKSLAPSHSIFSMVTIVIALVLLVFTLVEGRNLFRSSRARYAEVHGNYPLALAWYGLTDSSIFPRDGWLSRAGILIANGTPQQAQQFLDEAISRNPEDYRVWKMQGEVFLRFKKNDDALRAFEKAYAFGRYNDLGITRVLVESLSPDRKLLDARRHEFELLLNEFGLAIEQNTHFIDLSSNVEELSMLTEDLARIYPEEAALYRALAERSTEHAALERSRISGRARGLLW